MEDDVSVPQGLASFSGEVFGDGSSDDIEDGYAREPYFSHLHEDEINAELEDEGRTMVEGDRRRRCRRYFCYLDLICCFPCSIGSYLQDNEIVEYAVVLNNVQTRAARFTHVDDNWIPLLDNEFALRFLDRVQGSNLPHEQQTPPRLCGRCSNIQILSPDFRFSVNASDLGKTSQSCTLCSILSDCLTRYSINRQDVDLFKLGTTLAVLHNRQPMLRICAALPFPKKPPYVYSGAPVAGFFKSKERTTESNLQVGLPALAQAASRSHFELLREWVRVCNEEHGKAIYGCHAESYGFLPTRVLDVGDGDTPDLLRLCTTEKGDSRRYIALSHQWGKLRPDQRFRTISTNFWKFCNGIDFDRLPKTFQDAVTVTRELGVRFLWIDSLCIIQDDENDWRTEAARMKDVFGSAYCTIAASSASNSIEGFLSSRTVGRFVQVPNHAEHSLYLCEILDNFDADVEQGGLSRRGWVLQERALSRRTIHFSTHQTYWECGAGIHCETMTRMRNSKADFLGDPRFPKRISQRTESNRVRLAQILVERYSTLGLSFPTDRPIAISGLEEALARTLNTVAMYGIFKRYLHRSLLWQRSGDKRLMRIDYPADQKVPSWSWMAYDGKISYMDIPFHSVEWNNTIHLSPIDHDIAQGLNSGCVALRAPVVDLLFDRDLAEGRMVFDEQDWTKIQNLKCMVLGRRISNRTSGIEKEYYVIIVNPLDFQSKTHQRIGVGCFQKKDISWGNPEAEICIVV